MGVVNATPDSFHAASRGETADSAIELGLRLAGEGADILDVGGESTRPGASPLSEAAEIERIAPVVAALASRTGLPISVDTRHEAVARAAIDAGASIVNDMSAGSDPAMARLVADTQAGWVLAYARALPAPPREGCTATLGGAAPEPASSLSGSRAACRDAFRESAPAMEAIASDAVAFLSRRLDAALSAGVAREAVALDPGVGFTASVYEDVALVSAIPRIVALGCPVLAGVSRKRFVAELAGDLVPAGERLGGSIAAALACARLGARILRVHDVRATRQALAVGAALSDFAMNERVG